MNNTEVCKKNKAISIAYFVSPHGFGHASRACAVMEAVYKRLPHVIFEIFTTIPAWFFKDSLSCSFNVHPVRCDIGLVQKNPFELDIEQTSRAVGELFPPPEGMLRELASILVKKGCVCTISDITPMGIVAAQHSGIPAILVENFTWDWIYRGLPKVPESLERISSWMRRVYDEADFVVGAEPCCNLAGGAVRVPPVAREVRTGPAEVKKRLGVAPEEMLVLLTTGGIPGSGKAVLPADCDNTVFIVAGCPDAPAGEPVRCGNVIRLPARSGFHHPDLVAASDVVIGKAGYSTVAEVWQARTPFGYVLSRSFPETPVLAGFLAKEVPGFEISIDDFMSGAFTGKIKDLAACAGSRTMRRSGADIAARMIIKYIVEKYDLLEIVDTRGNPCGVAPRRCVHGDNSLLHRVVHLLVTDGNGRILLQKRSKRKRVAPGKWDTSVGGHVDFGETIEDALYREAGEELGIEPENPRFAYSYIHSNSFESELVHTYVCTSTGPFAYNTEEIDEIRFWGPSEIRRNLGKGVMSDNFEDEFARYNAWRKQNG